MASIVDSLVAPLSVVNALVVALCMKKQKEVVATLETLEKIWDESQVYSGDELNHVSSSMPGGKDTEGSGVEYSTDNRGRRGRNDGGHIYGRKRTRGPHI